MSVLMAMNSKSNRVPDTRPIVYIVDDDISVRESLQALLAVLGFRLEVFASAGQFLEHARDTSPGCLILDVSLPDLNGLDLQERVGRDQTGLPVIFITGHGDIPMTVRAMKAGAIEFLTKPFSTDALLHAVNNAIERSRKFLAAQLELTTLRERHASLSEREREVMSWVIRGLLNKQVAVELSISEITVKAHRGKMMRKMKARSLADLVTMAARLQQTPSDAE